MNILEQLIFDGIYEKEFKIYNKRWKIKTLNIDEYNNSVEDTEEYDNIAKLQAMKISILSRAVTECEGIKLFQIKENKEFLGRFSNNVIDKLYDKQKEMQKELNDSYETMETDIKN